MWPQDDIHLVVGLFCWTQDGFINTVGTLARKGIRLVFMDSSLSTSSQPLTLGNFFSKRVRLLTWQLRTLRPSVSGCIQAHTARPQPMPFYEVQASLISSYSSCLPFPYTFPDSNAHLLHSELAHFHFGCHILLVKENYKSAQNYKAGNRPPGTRKPRSMKLWPSLLH